MALCHACLKSPQPLLSVPATPVPFHGGPAASPPQWSPVQGLGRLVPTPTLTLVCDPREARPSKNIYPKPPWSHLTHGKTQIPSRGQDPW